MPSKLAFPIAVRVDLVNEHRPLLAAVARQISLTVTVNVEPPHPVGTGHRVLEDPRKDRPALPRHILRQADVDRQQRPDGLASRLVWLNSPGLILACNGSGGGSGGHRWVTGDKGPGRPGWPRPGSPS